MAYECRLMKKECDCCGECLMLYDGREEITADCPCCGGIEYEIKYYFGREWSGCDLCVVKRNNLGERVY